MTEAVWPSSVHFAEKETKGQDLQAFVSSRIQHLLLSPIPSAGGVAQGSGRPAWLHTGSVEPSGGFSCRPSLHYPG